MFFQTDTIQDLPQKKIVKSISDASLQSTLLQFKDKDVGGVLFQKEHQIQPYIITREFMTFLLASGKSQDEPAIDHAQHLPCIAQHMTLEKIPACILDNEGIIVFNENNEPHSYITRDSLAAILSNLHTKEQRNLQDDDKLTADISHSIQVIKSCCDYIIAEDSNSLPKSTREFIQRIHENSSLAHEMLLQLSKTNVWDIFHSSSHAIHLGQIINSWAVDLKMITFEREQQLQLDINRDIEITSDSGRLRSVLQNLIEHMSLSSETKAQITLSSQWNAGFAYLTLSSSHASDNMAPGHNYALRIARHLLEDLGGNLKVSNEDAKIVITVTLPDAILIEEKELQTHNPKVLIVDDDIEIAHFIAETLRTDPIDILLAENGEEGLKLFLEHRPDLIISDIKMPQMDGLQLLNRVKAQSRSTLFILSSGFYLNINEDISQNMFHADLVLPKPYNATQLRKSINRCLILHDHIPLEASPSEE